MRFVVLNPTSDPVVERRSRLADRVVTLENGILGIIDNRKHNSDTVLGRLARRLAERYQLKEMVSVRKHSFSHPLNAAEADQLAKCDFVIAGVGD
ncbi:MAG: hypothetical protein BAA01_16660 [Bacillus thermozeamaize]|uniref:UGSC-like domain-containing protein n=1 Tax=Bacillus thermozeamaize TaxID=230954 RepID=A0A1Y3PI67_9BACI|nr:MAG: hypothetical protein BAA01_16660 [Bacillus thermozeamaize]